MFENWKQVAKKLHRKLCNKCPECGGHFYAEMTGDYVCDQQGFMRPAHRLYCPKCEKK